MGKRINILLCIAGLFLWAVVLRTGYLQLYNGDNSGAALAEKALKFRTQIIAGEDYCRGEILDRNFLSLTDSGVRPALVVFPGSIGNVEDTARLLEERIGLAHEYTEKEIERNREALGKRAPFILKVNLEAADVLTLENQEITGIEVIPIKNRYGPESVARHLIGHLNGIDDEQWDELKEQQKTRDTNVDLPTSYRINDKIGVAGLEKKYEQALRGAKAEKSILAIADAGGKIMEGLGYKIQEISSDPWRNHLILTLDRRFQEIVEKVMDEKIARGAVVIVDVASGDILAAASRPNFDQNEVERFIDGYDELIDRTQRVAFYPGSVFKMVVATGVLEEKLIDPDEVFTCEGSYVFSDGTEIKCLQEHGDIDLIEAITKSCNTTFIQLGQRLGNDKLREYAAKLGFAVNLTSSSPPALLGNASIGQQGVLVSPLQVANLYATIARKGWYCPCRLVSSIRNYQGEVVFEESPAPSVQVMSEDTAALLQKALEKAVASGSGRQAWVQGKGTAGKTGTAQVNDEGRVIAWFAGYTPVEKPKYAIAVMIEENTSGARSGLQGGASAAPVFREIAEEIFELAEE